MKKNGLLQTILSAIRDPERVFEERMFLALAIASEATVSIALIGDLLVREDIREIATLIGVLITVPVLSYICLKKNRLGFAIKFTVIALVLAILPSLFFFGGGVHGGGVLWIVFAFIYVGLILTGSWRNVMFVLLFFESGLFYLVDYYHPELIKGHLRPIFYVDSFFSIIMIGIVCFSMNRIQNRILKDESDRARKAAEKAEELSRAQNRFFSSMSHEIRTPINSILGLNELILRDHSASDEIIKDASGIRGSGKMLLALINDILDFSKMEAGSMDIVPVDYKVSDLLSEVVNMIYIRANDKGLDFRVEVDPKVPSVLYGDEIRIKQVIINLLNNAVKYTPEGSIEFHIESTPKDEKTVSLSVSVSDTGMGIRKEALPHLFDAFKRVDEEKNRHIEGTGLGLSIVKELVDLMGGQITVNSVYGEGSTFTVMVDQGISDASAIGDLNIHSFGVAQRSNYEASFRAPDASVLIVDDNEMNLEVERKLLSDTDMTIDTAKSGSEALELALQTHYDAILMDHLMPGMDGIECLTNLRNQVGGMNRSTPVIILTANAGSENRDLYTRAGFDGYLVKPVSGEALEQTLVKYIAKDKLILNSSKVMQMHEDISASAGYSGKAPVVITSTSMCDLPNTVINKLNIPILPFTIRTDEGVFKDGLQMDADELIRYVNSGRNAVSAPPEEETYTEFFASNLKRAHHLIHIALTTSMSEDFVRASEAAKSFDNVTVINSECVSSATGLLVLIAYKLVQMNLSVEDIVADLEAVKHRLKCSFIVDTTEYMARRGLISPQLDRIARGLNLHPCISVQNDKRVIGGIRFGSRRSAYRRYIAKAFPVDVIPDPEVLFITYVDVPVDELLWIKEEVSKLAYFENVIFKQASAAISSNCGAGSFGLLYFVKTNKSYNLSSIVVNEGRILVDTEEDETYDYDDDAADAENPAGAGTADGLFAGLGLADSLNAFDRAASGSEDEDAWYRSLEGIDGHTAIKNSGSEEAFKTVLKIFYDSIEEKTAMLRGLYEEESWPDYTIKVHALKSSAKLIGAMELAEEAQLLENAGKEEDLDYIAAHHDSFLADYVRYKDILSSVFEKEESPESDQASGKPAADATMMKSAYDSLREAAEMMDCDAIEEILEELSEYTIPAGEKERFDAVTAAAGNFDYDGMLEILNA